MSAVATLPASSAGSVIPPCLTTSAARVTVSNWCFSARTSPDVPFWISEVATRTGVGAAALVTDSRYRERKISSIAAPISAHRPATARVPRRVASMRRRLARGDLVVVMAMLGPLFLIGEYGDTRCRPVEVARVVAGAAVVDA